MSHVFISYVRENSKEVQRLTNDLTKHGVKVWLDHNNIMPGVRWKQAIRQAIKQGIFFIACFSKEYNERSYTYMNEELSWAISELRQRPTDRVWFIPIKLNECEISDLDIGGGETLQDLQYIELYKDWEKGIQMLLSILAQARFFNEQEVLDFTKLFVKFDERFSRFDERLNQFEGHLTSLAESQVVRHQEELAEARYELEQLKSENETLRLRVNPPWRCRDFVVDSTLCFILMPFSQPWSDDVWKLIEDVVTKCGLRSERANEKEGRMIMDDIWEGICKACVVIADLTTHNPNVTYEVGLADVLGKEVIFLCQKSDVASIPFDFVGQRLIIYENSFAGVRKLSTVLERRLRNIVARSSKGTDK